MNRYLDIDAMIFEQNVKNVKQLCGCRIQRLWKAEEKSTQSGAFQKWEKQTKIIMYNK